MLSIRPGWGRLKSRLVSVRGLRFLTATALCTIAATSALAWKPNTHIYAANQAIAPILSGSDTVLINGESYPVDSRVATAIRNYPSHYRAGVVGPDAFPDIYVGQSVIHPDTRQENGTVVPGEFGPGHSFSFEWLRHVYEAGWAYYNDKGGNADGQKNLAFMYGFLTHAAGDMWAHTFVNNFARGIFPSLSDFPNLPIAVRHIVVESYIGKHTPTTDLSFANNSAALQDFVYWSMIAGGKEGGFVDSANNDTWALGRGAIFGFFWDLRWALDDRVEALNALGPLNPIYIISLPLIGYMDAWVDDIDDGLYAWPDLSQKIGANLFGQLPANFDGAGQNVEDFVFDHVLSMIGFPDPLVYVLDAINDLLAIFGDLIEPLADAATELRNYLIKQATGIDIEELKEYIFTPENHINNGLIGLDSNTSDVLDGLMGRTIGSSDPFNPMAFAAMKNTITTSALVLLSPDGLNQLLYDNRVGPIYQEGSINSDRDNFMLGFIRTLDGHEQWRLGTTKTFPNSQPGSPLGEGMPIWRDCLSRDRIFRTIFTDWEGLSFDDQGELGEDLGATPPPTSVLAVLGPIYSNGGVTYVGNTSTFQIAGTPDHFWNADEITVDGEISPGGTPANGEGSITIGPIVGADGVYTIYYNANGLCISGLPHGEVEKSADFTLDATPPTMTITPPAANLVLDVIHTSPFNFSAFDAGSGVKESAATLDGTPILDGAVIDAFYLNSGVHELIATGVDNIGNEGMTTRTFKVEATIAGLIAAMDRAYAEKLVTIPKKDNPYKTKLNAAQKSLTSGKIGTCKNNLASLAEMVKKNVGSGIDPVFGARYVNWIEDLINRL